MRCNHCPVRDNIACANGGHPFLCERLDPAHPRYAPEYGPIYMRHSEEAARLPSPAKMAANLARAFWDWAVSGFPVRSDEEQARIRAICAACPRWNPQARRCVLCGCFTDKAIAMKTKHCPLDPPKW